MTRVQDFIFCCSLVIEFLRQILGIVKIQFTLQEMKLSNVFSDSAIIY